MSEMALLTTRWDERLERWSDRLNPLVVREVRQSLKNRLFLLVFFLVLLGSWLVSAFLVLDYSGSIGYLELGPTFVRYYLLGLIGCLLFAIPVGAFFGMVQEFREKAFELLAITTLSPQTIVWGKIQGAVVMMLIYSSALAPFLSLSYLLGGLGLFPLFAAMMLLFAVSLTMTLFGIMMGALSQQPWLEVLNLLILLAAALVASTLSYTITDALVLRESFAFGELMMGLLCSGLFLGFVALISLGVAQAQLTTTFLPLDYRYGAAARQTATLVPSATNAVPSPPADGP
jgi:hypothetical protein